MKRTLIIAALAVLVALLFFLWPRAVEPPVDGVQPSPPAPVEVELEEVEVDAVPDADEDWRELLRDDTPTTLMPPTDRGLLDDLQEAVEGIDRTREVERETITVRPEIPPLPEPTVDDDWDDDAPEDDPDPA